MPETIVSDDEFEDSLRLPNYSSRSRRRFHPYWPNILARLDIAPPEEETRYWVRLCTSYILCFCLLSEFIPQNTVLDDEYVPLDVPSFLQVITNIYCAMNIYLSSFQMPVQQVEQMPLVEDMAAPPAPLQDDGDHEVNLVEQRRQRLWRLHATIIVSRTFSFVYTYTDIKTPSGLLARSRAGVSRGSTDRSARRYARPCSWA